MTFIIYFYRPLSLSNTQTRRTRDEFGPTRKTRKWYGRLCHNHHHLGRFQGFPVCRAPTEPLCWSLWELETPERWPWRWFWPCRLAETCGSGDAVEKTTTTDTFPLMILRSTCLGNINKNHELMIRFSVFWYHQNGMKPRAMFHGKIRVATGCSLAPLCGRAWQLSNYFLALLIPPSGT